MQGELETIITPFDEDLIVTLLNSACQPVALNNLEDVRVILVVNGVEQFVYQKEAATGIRAWEPGPADGTGNIWTVLCQVTESDTNGWRGLLAAQVQLIVTADDFPDLIQNVPFYQQGLFLLQLGAATTITPTPPSDITFECAFTCDIDQNLWFTATVTGPNSNYVVQIQVEDNWCLLYDAYLSITDAEGDTPGTGTYENDEPIALPAQIVMGTYPIRVWMCLPAIPAPRLIPG